MCPKKNCVNYIFHNKYKIIFKRTLETALVSYKIFNTRWHGKIIFTTY